MSAPGSPVTTASAGAALAPVAPTPTGGITMQLGRLVVWELFLAWRRRAMVITLASLLLVGYLLTQGFIWLTWASLSDSPQSQAVIAQALGFPTATAIAGQYFTEVGTLLLIVLVGALIGSEYAYGTHRLSLARGVGRIQLLAAQVIAVALLALISSGALMLVGTALGVIGGLAIGAGSALSVAGIGELMTLWLAIALNVFAYSLIAFCIGTVGRSVAAAVAGPLVYIFVEYVVTNILNLFRDVPNPDATTRFLSSIPDYLLGPNVSELILLSGRRPYELLDYSGHLGAIHAAVVVGLYCALFIGSAALVFRARDVRE